MSTAAVCNSYKQDVLNGVHQPGDTYKIALYNGASLDKTTTAYTATGEVSGTGYSAGGTALSGFTVSASGDTAYIDWTTDPTWASSSITADSALIYNSSRSNKAVAVLTFTSSTSAASTFTVQLPAPGATAVITLT